MDQPRLRPFATAALFVVSLVVSVWLLDFAFRAYENRFWIHQIEPDAERYALGEYEYNDHEEFVAKRKRPDEFRILSFGDSYAQSSTKPAYSYASVLQTTLAQRLDRQSTRVVNFGVGLTSFPDYIAQYGIWSKKLEYDGVLFNIFAGNDFREASGFMYIGDIRDRYRPVARQASEEMLRFGPGVAIPHKYPLRFLDYLAAQYLSRRYGQDESDFYRESGHASPAAYLKNQVRQTRAYRLDAIEEFADSHYWLFKLLVLAEQVRESKQIAITIAPPHAVVSPVWMKRVTEATAADGTGSLNPALPGMVVRELAARAGYQGPIIDLTECLIAATARGEELYFGTNTHWSVLGNERVGGWLAAKLDRAWFQSDRSTPDACDTQPAAPTQPIADALASNFDGFRDLLEFESSAMSSLLGNSFGSVEQVFQELERLGYRRSETLAGSFLLHPSYLAPTSQLAGWVTNDAAPEDPAFIVFFRDGRLQSVGRTRPPDPSQAKPEQGNPPLRFRSRIRGKPVQVAWDLWAVAITDGGLFAPLTQRERLGRSRQPR